MSEIVLIELVRSYCLLFLIYCSESFSNDKETIAELSSCWRKAFRKIFGLPPWSSVDQILLFTSVLPLEYVRRLNFMTNLQSLPNERVVMISQICRNSDYRDLYIKYDVDVECSKSGIKSAVADCFANNMTV